MASYSARTHPRPSLPTRPLLISQFLPPYLSFLVALGCLGTHQVEGISGPVAMVSLGTGLRIKKVGPIKAQVYALGVFVERTGGRGALESFKGKGSDPGLFEALLSSDEPFFPRMLHFVFARSVKPDQVTGALGERLKPNLPPEVQPTGPCFI